MDWQTDALATEQQQHTSVFNGQDFNAVKEAVLATIDHACSMFDETVLDSSMFCLFEWQSDAGSLTVVVTDETKQQEGKHRVTAVLPECRGEVSEDFVEDMRAIIRDYLTTCLPFLQYSLIAGFTASDRTKITML